MTDESLEEWIVGRLSEALIVPVKDINPVVPFARLGVDSMVMIGFATELESLLGRPIDPQVLFEHRSPRALALYLNAGS
jgi:acyl carrier protein